jgi:hypothetical protein
MAGLSWIPNFFRPGQIGSFWVHIFPSSLHYVRPLSISCFFLCFASVQICETYLPARGKNKQAFKNKVIFACCSRTWKDENLIYFIYQLIYSRPRGAVVRASGAKIWWSLRRGFESHCGMWVLVFRRRPYKPRSRVAVGMAW